MPPLDKVRPLFFYGQFHGHPLDDLAVFHAATISQRQQTPIIYCAGDSSLDNKFWVPSAGPGGEPLPVHVPEIYRSILEPPRPKPDVAFWLNHLLGARSTALNTAVEESMLRDRDADLLPHDKFIRDHIRSQDILVVSVGANDIAFKPTAATAMHMLNLAWLTSRSSIEKGTASSLGYFANLFGSRLQLYVEKLVGKQRPCAVVVCMIYYPLEAGVGSQQSWADLPLKTMGYNRDPGQLQAAIRKMYELATSKIRVDGTQVLPCALYEVMDGKDASDYVQRAEPSVQGGRKMAKLIIELLEEAGVVDKLSNDISA